MQTYEPVEIADFLCPDCNDYHTNPGAGNCPEGSHSENQEGEAPSWWHYCSWCLNGSDCTQAGFDAHIAGHFACLNS